MKTAAAFCLVAVTLTACVCALMRFGNIEAGRTARGALEEVESVLHVTPTVTVASYVALQKTTDILELATVSKSFPQEYSFEHTFMGSTKKLQLRGDYSVKAGFDLRKRFALQVDQRTKTISADFPAPKILSVEMTHYTVLADEDGWWNKLTPHDREQAVNAMNATAAQSALSMNILQEAKDSVEKRLLQYGAANGLQWQIHYRDGAPKPAN